ncbi:MAG: methyltransferase domain-containing protein [Actinomycetota bacterium]|nr:methyltransferase domain-containing protein [Actinomycetota bacterium]
MAHPAAADALIVEKDFERDERLPYWAELWPSALALARYISKERLSGRRVIELGCGLGLPSLAAFAFGARVTATDHYVSALDFTRYNARVNLEGWEPETLLLDWHEPHAEDLYNSFDLVLAADVLYEPRNVSALAALIPSLLAPGGEALLADPRRKHAPAFLERMIEAGFLVSTEEYFVPANGRNIAVLIHQIE